MDFSVLLASGQKLAGAFVAWLPRLGLSLLVLVAFVLGARAVRWTVGRALSGGESHKNLRLAVERLAYGSVIAISVLVAATIAFPSFTVGSLIQLLGVSGVVVGFAFKDIFQNFLAGILILITNPFMIGDQITVDIYEGTVEEVQTRATLIRTFDRRRVVVPNSDMFTKAVLVSTAFPQRRVEYDLDLPAGADIADLRRRFTELLHSSLEGVSSDPRAEVLVLKVGGDGSATLRLRWWSDSE
ncbi:MAG TPA: mechanosensitive ion channel domain-containing protein, partial [Gemmatimonadaceae bacterium]|nr:mechanosensitive ion channel domain-containing protein [Gemmatimonadaceae bacterium]